MPPKATHCFVVFEYFAGEPVFAEVCMKEETANAVAEKLHDAGKEEVTIAKVNFDISATKKASGKKAPKKAKETSEEVINDSATQDEVEVEDAAPAKTKKKTPKKKASATADDDDDGGEKEDRNAARKIVPEGVEGALAGLKLMFTGTMELDRSTMQSTAGRYGGQVTKKLGDADYVVLGKKPGPKKMQEINDAGIKTMSEAEFMQRIEGDSTSTSEPLKKKLKTG